MKETEYWIGLFLVPGIGESRLKNLVSKFGSARSVFEAPVSQLRSIGFLDNDTISSLSNPKYIDEGRRHVDQLSKLGARVVTFLDPDYPKNLKELDEAPPILYCMGTMREEDSLSIAIVGSRRATAYGRAASERLSFELANEGITIVSGFATGIDTAAHRGALRANGRTIAVLGCGLDVNYPAVNRNLRRKIMSSGVLITEFPLGTQPLPGNFPKRNRIVSGLSLGIVVVEASIKSGTFSTVSWAAEQGREVFAVPGDINRKTSSGTNKLIGEGAKITTCADDVLEEIGMAKRGREVVVHYDLTEREKFIVESLEYGPVHVDEIAERLKIPVNETLSLLLSLELKGAVKQTPGKIYSLN